MFLMFVSLVWGQTDNSDVAETEKETNLKLKLEECKSSPNTDECQALSSQNTTEKSDTEFINEQGSLQEAVPITPEEAQKKLIDHSEIRQLLIAGDAKNALKKSKRLLEELQCLQRVPITSELATIWVDQGYGYHLLERDEDVQIAWEQAFSIDREVQFDEHLFEGLPDEAQEELLDRFEQVRGLVNAQGVVDPLLPELDGVNVFIDGKNIVSGQGVKLGIHVAQIVCPLDGLQSQWTDFVKPLNWEGMCPSGFPESAESQEEDFFSNDLFGAQVGTSEYYNPEPLCSSNGFTISLPDNPMAYSLSAGAGLTLAGAVAYYSWLVPAFDEVLMARQRSSITVNEAEEISAAFNVARFTTLGLLLSGTTLTGYGAFLATQSVSVHPIWLPNGIGVAGQF